MQARNPKHNGDGTIDMEVEHPAFGWIPFTASPGDVEAHGRELFTRAAGGEFGTVAAYVPTTTNEQAGA